MWTSVSPILHREPRQRSPPGLSRDHSGRARVGLASIRHHPRLLCSPCFDNPPILITLPPVIDEGPRGPATTMEFFTAGVAQRDPMIAEALASEGQRQQQQIELIASENIVSRAVIEALGHEVVNKTLEGYPGARYHAGGGASWT